MPGPGQATEAPLRFGRFELDRRNFELRRDGKAVKIEKSPLELLLVLAERAGKLVLQEEAAELVWGKNVHIEVGSALYTAVKKIRIALGDTSKNPKYIETAPRKGYRFVAKCNQPRQRREEAVRSARPMLAVLPLENLSGDRDQEYFSDGMTEEIITELGRISTQELGVLARTSVMRYKRTRKNIREIGRQLGVDYLVEGSVRRDGGRVRIAVQLIRADDETHLWTEVFERATREVLRIQADVAQAVAEAIRIRLLSKAEQKRDVEPDLYDLYLRGRFFQGQLIPPALRKAIACYERVLSRSGDFAPAWAALAECYVRLPITSDIPPVQAFPQAKEAAERAIGADSSLGAAYAARSGVGFWHLWNWKSALADSAEAEARNPSLAEAYLLRSHVHSNLGMHREAIFEIAQAKKLDPFSRIISTLHGQFHYQAGQRFYGEAEELLRYALVVDPQFWVAHVDLSKIWGMQGKYAKAVAAAQRAYRYSHGNGEATSLAGWAHAMAGQKALARKKLQDLEHQRKKRYVPPIHKALILAGLGETNASLDEIDRALEERDVRLVFLLVEPRWDPLRGNGRFQAAVGKMNFFLS